MKKYIAILLSVFVLFGVSACNSTTPNEPEPTKQEETQDNTDSKDILDNDIAAETTELAEFDITGDEFIDAMNNVLEITHPDLVLTDLKIEESEKDGVKQIIYYTMKNDVFVSYTVNKDSNNIYLFDTIIENDSLNENTHFNASIYFATAVSILDSETEINDLIENLNMTDYTSTNGTFYKSNKAEYAKVTADNKFSFIIRATNNNN